MRLFKPRISRIFFSASCQKKLKNSKQKKKDSCCFRPC